MKAMKQIFCIIPKKIVPLHQEWFHRLIDVWTWLAMFSLSQWIGCCSACITSHQKPLLQDLKKELFFFSMVVGSCKKRLDRPQNMENSHFKTFIFCKIELWNYFLTNLIFCRSVICKRQDKEGINGHKNDQKLLTWTMAL